MRLGLSLSLSSLRPSGGTPTPTPTPVITFDGTTFANTLGNPGPWQADGVAIPGETGATMAYVEATMAGRAIQQSVGGVLSKAVVVTASDILYQNDFTGADANLSTLPGWTQTFGSAGVLVRQNGQLRRLQTGNCFCRLDTGSPRHGLSFRRLSPNGAPFNSSMTGDLQPVSFYLWTNSAKTDYLLFTMNYNSFWITSKDGVVPNTTRSTSGAMGGAFVDVDIRFPVVGGITYVQVYFNGAPRLTGNGVALTGSSVLTTGYTNLTIEATTLTPSVPLPHDFLDDLVVRNYAAADISLAVASQARSPDYPNQTRVTLTGGYSGAVDEIEFLALLTDGTVVKNWTAGSPLAGGTINQSVDIPLTTGEQFVIVGRDPSNPATAASVSATAPILPTVSPYRRGVNEGYVTEWTTADRERNMFAAVPLRMPEDSEYMYNFSDAETGLTPDGQYHAYPIRVSTGLPYTKLSYSIPLAARGKTIDITYPASMAASFKSLVDVTVLQGPSGGTAKIVVGANSNGWIELSGAIPAAGVGPTNVTAYKVGETDKTSYLSDEFTAGMAAWATGGHRLLYRNLIGDEVNSQRRAVAAVNTGGQSTGPLSPKAWGEISRLNGTTDLWVNMGHLNPDSYIADSAAALNLAINPASLVCPEMSNEVGWNNGFTQHRWFYYEGAKAGFHVSGTVPAPIPGLLDFIDQTAKIDRSTGALGVAVASGAYIAYARTGAGWFVAQANSNRPIGDIVPTATNANWTIIADNTAMARAMKRQYAARSEVLFDAYDAEFGASRIVPVIAYQQGGPQADILEWNNLYLKLAGRGRYAIAPYWGPELGTWGSYATGWGATEQGLINTDIPAFKTAFFNAAAISIQAKLDETVASANALAAWCVSKGLSKDAIQLASYECNWHVIFSGAWPAAINTVFGELIRDPRMGDMMTLYATGLATRIGGDHCWFDRIGKIPTSGTLQSWAITENEADTTSSNARFTALMGVV